jgi:hypothetical protein
MGFNELAVLFVCDALIYIDTHPIAIVASFVVLMERSRSCSRHNLHRGWPFSVMFCARVCRSFAFRFETELGTTELKESHIVLIACTNSTCTKKSQDGATLLFVSNEHIEGCAPADTNVWKYQDQSAQDKSRPNGTAWLENGTILLEDTWWIL